MTISHDDFSNLTRSLVGLAVSRPWQGYGSMLFLDLGNLTTERYNVGRWGEQEFQKGEACIQLGWGWRFEDDSQIMCGSEDTRPDIGDFIQSIIGSTIKEIQLYGAPPEISILLSSGIRLKSMTTFSGDPQWSTRLIGGKVLVCKNGAIFDLSSCDELDGLWCEEDAEYDARVKETAVRWGKPEEEPVKGQCQKCRDFIRIDCHVELLDYGVCGSSSGPLDGKVVHMQSGCPMFAEDRPS